MTLEPVTSPKNLLNKLKITKEALNSLSSHTRMFVCTKLQLHLIHWLRLNFTSGRLILTARHWQGTVSESKQWVNTGAIIRDGDHKRAPFLVLRLTPWYGTIFLFLEQIVPSPAAHLRTCCEDFCGCRTGEMASEIHEIFYAFGPHLDTFMSVRI